MFSRVSVLLVALLVLTGVATPPVIEDHLEPGFCSTDCPVQHAGHGSAIAPAASAGDGRRAPAAAAAAPHGGEAARLADGSPDAPRAPPSA
jgi:hypothetical protein